MSNKKEVLNFLHPPHFYLLEVLQGSMTIREHKKGVNLCIIQPNRGIAKHPRRTEINKENTPVRAHHFTISLFS
jgi:hypothetical protein